MMEEITCNPLFTLVLIVLVIVFFFAWIQTDERLKEKNDKD